MSVWIKLGDVQKALNIKHWAIIFLNNSKEVRRYVRNFGYLD